MTSTMPSTPPATWWFLLVPALVVSAGAGSGKTRVLVERYSNPLGVVVWSQGFSRIRPPKGSTPFHNQFRIAICASDQ